MVYPILNHIYLGNFKISVIFFLVASLTDALDGFLARKMHWQTDLGQILDPVADKLLLSRLRSPIACVSTFPVASLGT